MPTDSNTTPELSTHSDITVIQILLRYHYLVYWDLSRLWNFHFWRSLFFNVLLYLDPAFYFTVAAYLRSSITVFFIVEVKSEPES